VRDSDAEIDGKPHAVRKISADGHHTYVWDLSDVELTALYEAIGARVHSARYRVEVAEGRIRELVDLGPEMGPEIGHHRRAALRRATIQRLDTWEPGGTQET
jgi:hypothetical protein